MHYYGMTIRKYVAAIACFFLLGGILSAQVSVSGRLSGTGKDGFSDLAAAYLLTPRHQLGVHRFGTQERKPFDLYEGELRGQQFGLSYRHYLKSARTEGFFGGVGLRTGRVSWSGRERTVLDPGNPLSPGETLLVILTAGIVGGQDYEAPQYAFRDFRDEFSLTTLEGELGYRFRLADWWFLDVSVLAHHHWRGPVAPEVDFLVQDRFSGAQFGFSVGTALVF